VDGMPNPKDTNIQNNREYSRVQAHIPLEISIVSPEEIKDLQSRTEKKTIPFMNPPNDVEDPSLAEWLRFLNVKMDTILGYLDKEHVNSSNMILKSIMIGGAGFSFVSTKKYSLTDTLEVKMLLPSSTPLLLYLYCKVVQSEGSCDGYFTALRFIQMDDSIRDKILRFVFEKEREILRAKRKE
jgi:hypothetical protein